MITVELRPNVFVMQVISRTASTGREMFSVNILIDTVGGGQLKVNTFWSDMPYKLPFPIIKRIKNLVTEMVTNGWSVETINNVLSTRYYSGFPKKQNCSDYERFVKSHRRAKNIAPRLDGFYNLAGNKSTDRGAITWLATHYITRQVDGEWVSSPTNCPDNSICIERLRH